MIKNQITNIEVKKNNRNRIFRYICKHNSISNPDIAYQLKISLPTVTQNTKELIERGLIEETGELQSTGGRRAKALSVVSNFKIAVGLDITKNHIGLILTNLIGEILKYDRIYMPYTNSSVYYKEVNQKLEEFLEDSVVKKNQILGIGISFPGIVDLQKAEIAYSHILGVEKLSFSAVSCYFSYPCYFLNDANAGAYAEGTHLDISEHFFYLSLSNTVGGAIYNHGELIQGKDFRCGEVGHMTIIPNGALCYCGKLGCMDAYCSAICLSRMTDRKLERFFMELKNGKKEIVDVWDEYTTYLSIAINNIHMLLDCDIILGGYVGSCIEAHIQDIRRKVVQRNIFIENEIFVRICNYKVGAAALGAALNVIETFVEQI